jgi:uncharacterized membrane protein (DUF4010 family)
MAAAVAPSAARALAPVALGGLGVAAALGGLRLATATRAVAPAAAPPGPAARGPLRLREAFIVALLLSVVSLLVAGARELAGNAGLFAGSALAGLADAQSPVGALSTLFAGGSLAARDLVLGVLLAVSSNGLTRIVTAVVAGGPAYGAQVATAIVAGTGTAWAIAWGALRAG